MLLQQSFNEYNKAKHQENNEDLWIITKICKCMCLPQKTISFVWYLYFAVKNDEQIIEPDDVTLFTAIIDLACKACETHRSPTKILEAVAGEFSIALSDNISEMYHKEINITQLEICMVIDFSFEMTEIYTKLHSYCFKNNLDAINSKRCWLLLNDIMNTPLCIYFTADEIITTIFFINFLSVQESNTESNGWLFEQFSRVFDIKKTPVQCVDFILSQLVNSE